MKEEDAWSLYQELESELAWGWKPDLPGKDVNEYRRTVNWTVAVTKRRNRGSTFRFPTDLNEYVEPYDLVVIVDVTDDLARITLDNSEADELELTEAERERRELEQAIRNEFDFPSDVVSVLADEFDSVDDIITASRSELTAISGIGDRRVSHILHRHSELLEQRIDETSDQRTIPVIEDDGVLRLPEELEDRNEEQP